jgi:protein ImuB
MFCCLSLDPASAALPGVLATVAQSCSPRVEIFESAAIFDATGLSRVIGAPAEIAGEVQRLAASHGIVVRVAIARTMTAAWLLAHARSGATVAMGEPAEALAPLPVGWLGALVPSSGPRSKAQGPSKSGKRKMARAGNFRQAPGPDGFQPEPATADKLGPWALGLGPDAGPDVADLLAIFERWGLRTLGDLASLPRGNLRARLGPTGVRLHQAACGEDVTPLVPTVDPPAFVERIELEWPIEGLEPLSFVLSRLCDALSLALERADRGAVAITTRLGLVTRATHERTLTIPSPMRDARVLRTLIVLDLESHPPPAAIDVVEVRVDVTPGRIEQRSLLARTVPAPEDLATLLARLHALMGDTRVGAPALVDTHDERAVAMSAFSVRPQAPGPRPKADERRKLPGGIVRRFRLPIAARVDVERGTPVRVDPSGRDLPGGRVVACAGPWRSSGLWWSIDGGSWDRYEWDVEIAGGTIYRLARGRERGQWEIDGVVD